MASTTECDELQSFLGLAAYNRQFITGFFFIAERLFNLCTKKCTALLVTGTMNYN